jgi:hypothetical protein
MRVRATKLGYFGHKRIKEGTEFVLKNPEKQFSKTWMVEVKSKGKPSKHEPEMFEDEDLEDDAGNDQEVI